MGHNTRYVLFVWDDCGECKVRAYGDTVEELKFLLLVHERYEILDLSEMVDC